jgi:hypothetical protein
MGRRHKRCCVIPSDHIRIDPSGQALVPEQLYEVFKKRFDLFTHHGQGTRRRLISEAAARSGCTSRIGNRGGKLGASSNSFT